MIATVPNCNYYHLTTHIVLMKLIRKLINKVSSDDSVKTQHKALFLKTPMFEEQYYIAACEAASIKGKLPASRGEAITHYLDVGACLGLNPSSAFDTTWYLERYRDVRQSGMNPLAHYLLHGKQEGRLPKPSLLEQVDFLPQIKNRQDIVFYSSRTDGFGERMKSLLNAMVLADYFQSDFKFSWPQSAYLGSTHAIESPQETFSDSFLTSHMVEENPDNVINLENLEVIDEVKSEQATLLKVSQLSLVEQYPSLVTKLKGEVFARAFKTIQFSRNLNEAIALANRLPIQSPSVSIHLRSGDIVYGRYRFDDRYTNKVISYAQADFMINECKRNGLNVVIFGQADKVCRKLADKYNVLYFGDNEKLTGMTSSQQAIFDMVLMSRTDKIYAGNSGFSQLAELIGKAKICSPEQDFEHQAMSEFIMELMDSKNVQGFDEFQNAFSCWHLVFYFKGIIGLGNAIRIMERALAYKGDCLFYRVVLATLHFENGDLKQAGNELQEVMNDKASDARGLGGYEYLTKHRYSDGKSPLHKYRGILLQMSKAGINHAGTIFKELR